MKVLDHFSEWYESKNALIALICVSAAIKLLIFLFNKPFNSDGVLYITAAQHFASGNFAEGLPVYPMPLYPLLIAIVHFLVPNWEYAAKLVSMTSMVLATIPLYLLTAHLFDRRAAFWAGLALAVAPLPNDWAVDVIRGPVFIFFVLMAVYYAHIAIDSKRILFFVLTVLFSCISFMLRVEGVLIITFFYLYGITLIFSRREEKVPYLKSFFVSIIVLAVFAGTWLQVMRDSGEDFNRVGEVASITEHILELGFLENYQKIYDQLTDLEKQSPNPHGRQNLAEVTRHFMPVIYLLGQAEVFFTVLFPIFAIPLLWGLRGSLTRRYMFLFLLLIFYLSAMYLRYIDRDLMQRRFLFAPAVLAFPWVGMGLERIFAGLKNSSRPKVYLAVFIIAFILLPVVKVVNSTAEADDVLRTAGRWVAENENMRDARFLSNDRRTPFFADVSMENWIDIGSAARYNFAKMERFALKRNVDVLLVKVPKNSKPSKGNSFSAYKKIKEFRGKERDVHIYCRPSFCGE